MTALPSCENAVFVLFPSKHVSLVTLHVAIQTLEGSSSTNKCARVIPLSLSLSPSKNKMGQANKNMNLVLGVEQWAMEESRAFNSRPVQALYAGEEGLNKEACSRNWCN